MNQNQNTASTSVRPKAGNGLRLAAALGLSLLLAACVVPGPRPPRPLPPRPTPTPPTPTPSSFCAQPPLPPAARSNCPGGRRPIGVLAVVSDTVCRNSHHAINGERVCDGDTIITDASGVGEVLPDGGSESDAVHVAEGTDPRFTWTRGGCLSIDNYRYGRVIVTAQRHCMVIRTRDTLMLLVGGRAQFEVKRGAGTSVVPLRGTLTKLQPLSAQQVYNFAPAQLARRSVAPSLQPQLQSLNVYFNDNLTRPAVRLPPTEIRRIDGSVLRRAVVPIRPPVAPDIR